MLFQVDAHAAEPIFEQIVFQVKGGVAQGELAAGDRLPSVRDLARRLSVNPNTVIKAYDTLHREGVIVRRQGAGCFVSDAPSGLADAERARQLDQLVERTVTEAFHLGFGAGEIREAVDRHVKSVRFPGKNPGKNPHKNPGKNKNANKKRSSA